MRIYLKTTPATGIIPFNYQTKLVGAFHKWIGNNNAEHDALSLYSLSWLSGGKAHKEGGKIKGLTFPEGGTWFISAYDTSIIKRIIDGMQSDPEIAFGMEVEEATLKQPPLFKREEAYFKVATPIFIKRTEGERDVHYRYQDPRAPKLLEETLHHKLKEAGLEDPTLSIAFDTSYHRAKTKKVNYGKMGLMANVCPVIMQAKPETLAFAWDVGLGNSTGIGFGAIC